MRKSRPRPCGRTVHAHHRRTAAAGATLTLGELRPVLAPGAWKAGISLRTAVKRVTLWSWDGPGVAVWGWTPASAEPAVGSHRARFQLLTALSFLLVTSH